jgi:hypothetical protein
VNGDAARRVLALAALATLIGVEPLDRILSAYEERLAFRRKSRGWFLSRGLPASLRRPPDGFP